MKINTFELERYFARHEFSARYLLSSSDCQALPMAELLAMAGEQMAQMWGQLELGYTETLGHPLLREAIAALYREIEAEDLLVAAPQECIFLIMHALLAPGDHVVCTFPGYQSLYEVARSIGCEVSFWQPHEQQGWYFDPDDLAGLLKTNTKLVITNFPHNPTGYLPSQGDFARIIALLQERGIFLLSDEMYRFLELVDGSTLPSACERYEKAVTLFGLSKTFGLPGLRIGWLASQDKDALEAVAKLKDYTTICSSAPAEILAIIALRNRAAIIQAQAARLRRNMNILEKFFADHQDSFSWNPPRGGSVCFPRMLSVANTYDFCEKLVAEAGIMLAPSRAFQYGDQHVRFGFGRENLPQVVDRFANFINQR